MIDIVNRCNISNLEVKNRNSTIISSFHAFSLLAMLKTGQFLLGLFSLDHFAMDRCQNINFGRLEASATPKNTQNSEFL